MEVSYYKLTVQTEDSQNPTIVEIRGPYTVNVDSDNLEDILEAVFEYDNLHQTEGPSLTGYSTGTLLDYVIVNRRGKRIVAYCAPIGWLVLTPVPEADAINSRAVLPHGLTSEEIRNIFTKIQPNLPA